MYGPILRPEGALAGRPALALRLYRARLAAGLSQQGLAEQVGIDRTRISRFETGALTPNAEHLDRLRRAVGW